MPPADQAFSALLDDLDARGLLDETLVVWTGEFGRTPRVGQAVVGGAGAGRDGRDHWPHCFSSVLAGGGIKGGTVYGASDRWAAYPARDPVTPADVAATVYHLLGVDPAHELIDPLGPPPPPLHGRADHWRPGLTMVNGTMSNPQDYPYATYLNEHYQPMELVDVPALIAACTDRWYNQTLCRVNDSVVRLGVMQGEYHWHRHHDLDEFFFVLEGRFLIDLEGRTVSVESPPGIRRT